MATDCRINVQFSNTRARRPVGREIIVRCFNRGAIGRAVASPVLQGVEGPHRCRGATMIQTSIHMPCVEKHCVSDAWYSRALARLFRRRGLRLFGLSRDGLAHTSP